MNSPVICFSNCSHQRKGKGRWHVHQPLWREYTSHKDACAGDTVPAISW